MATFRKIHVSFWGDSFVQELTPEQKYFYLYLMTNEKTTQCGIYETSLRNMAFDTGYNNETVQKLLDFFQYKKKIHWSKETNEIAVLNWMKFNDSTSPKVKGCINKELMNIKNKDLITIMGHEAAIGMSFNKNYRVSNSMRDMIFKKDGNCCKKCRSIKNLQIDHIIPRSIGGKSVEGNLRCLCQSCNSSRPILGYELIEEIKADGLDFEELCKINDIQAYAYSMRRDTQEEEEEEEEEEKEQEAKSVPQKISEETPKEFPLPEMFKVWMKHFPDYPKSISADYTALSDIVQSVKGKQVADFSIPELTDFTQKLAKAVLLHNFYRNKPLKTIANNIQAIIPILKDPKAYLDDLAKPKEKPVLTDVKIVLNDGVVSGYPESKGVKLKL